MEFTNNDLPNPKCCYTSNPKHLCPKCTAAYQGNRASYLGFPSATAHNKTGPEKLDTPSHVDMLKAAKADAVYKGPSEHKPGRIPQADRLEIPQASDYMPTASDADQAARRTG